MFSYKKGKHVQTRENTLNSFLQKLCPFLDLDFVDLVIFLNTPDITKYIYLELISSKVSRKCCYFKLNCAYIIDCHVSFINSALYRFMDVNIGIHIKDYAQNHLVFGMFKTNKMSQVLGKGSLTLYQTIPTFNDPKEEGLGKHSGKRENAGNQHFLLFPQCFQLDHKEKLSFWQCLICPLQMLSIWSCPKKCRLTRGA